MKRFLINENLEQCKLYAYLPGQFLLTKKAERNYTLCSVGSEIKDIFKLKDKGNFLCSLVTQEDDKIYAEYSSLGTFKNTYYDIETKQVIEPNGRILKYLNQSQMVKLEDVGIISGIFITQKTEENNNYLKFFLGDIKTNKNEIIIFKFRKFDGISLKIMKLCEEDGIVIAVCISPDKLTAAALIEYKNGSHEVVIIDLE